MCLWLFPVSTPGHLTHFEREVDFAACRALRKGGLERLKHRVRDSHAQLLWSAGKNRHLAGCEPGLGAAASYPNGEPMVVCQPPGGFANAVWDL